MTHSDMTGHIKSLSHNVSFLRYYKQKQQESKNTNHSHSFPPLKQNVLNIIWHFCPWIIPLYSISQVFKCQQAVSPQPRQEIDGKAEEAVHTCVWIGRNSSHCVGSLSACWAHHLLSIKDTRPGQLHILNYYKSPLYLNLIAISSLL